MALLESNLIMLDVNATTSVDALTQVAKLLWEHGVVKETYPDAIIKREISFPTGLQTTTVGVAIPHTDPEHVNESKMAIARLNSPVQFKQMGDGTDVQVQLIFMLALEESHSQLTMLSGLMTMFQDSNTMNELLTVSDTSKIINILKNNDII